MQVRVGGTACNVVSASQKQLTCRIAPHNTTTSTVFSGKVYFVLYLMIFVIFCFLVLVLVFFFFVYGFVEQKHEKVKINSWQQLTHIPITTLHPTLHPTLPYPRRARLGAKHLVTLTREHSPAHVGRTEGINADQC